MVKWLEMKFILSTTLRFVWLDWFEGIYCSRGWIWVDKGCLVDLILKDGLGEICSIGSSLIWRDLKGWNWKLWNSPCKWSENYEISLTLEITKHSLLILSH